MKKGYILLYVLLVGALCTLMILYIFRIQLENLRTAESVNSTVLINEPLDEDKEFLFTYLNNYIISNLSEKGINEDNIKNLLSPIYISFKINYKDSYASYDNTNNTFKIEYPIDDYSHREDTYNYSVIDNAMHLKFNDTIYYQGKFK